MKAISPCCSTEARKEEEEERLMLQKARELDAFDQQNHGAVPQYNDKNYNRDKNGFQGANSVKATSYEEEALRTMKAFWLPSATPEAPKKVEAPSTDTICPEGKEKLRLKTLFPIYLTEDTSEQKRSSSLDKTYICPSCKVTLTNTLSLVALSSCGHVFCKKCADKFMVVDKVCLACDKPCKERNLVNLAKGGTGFAGHGDHLEATDFKHLGSGSGLGLVRPAAKT
ncbi:UNVERIFIED_CONTAM: E3 ubiquitin-protein ligase CSU1 [Sesamum angustifolium]|uniref:E3 ubiquitin-protein ligase CSU1 n=1 Tax=Sesamum angustifolium TaxID=2727405 RepID=A0AAW2KVN7_9LAMI